MPNGVGHVAVDHSQTLCIVGRDSANLVPLSAVTIALVGKRSRDKVARRRKRVDAKRARRPKVIDDSASTLRPGDTGSGPWPRDSRRINESLDAAGATIGLMGNQYGPAFEGDAEYTWCLCYACGQPFQYWGAFGVQTSASELKGVSDEIGAGPCTHCGGAGKPMRWFTRTRDGVRSSVSSESAFELFDFVDSLREELEQGELSVEQASARLRDRGGPFTRLADWLDARQGTISAVGVLVGVLALIGPTVAKDDTPAPSDRQIEQIIVEVLKHYDRVNPPIPAERKSPAPRREPTANSTDSSP